MIGKREMQKITITEKEAIKLLNESYIVDYEGNTDRHRINLEKFLISTLEEIHQYRERWKSAGKRWRSKRKRDLWSGLMERCIFLIVNMIIPV